MVHLKSLFRRPSSYETVYPYDSHQQRPEFPPYDPELAEVYRHRRHIGVNLGSVFILNKQGSPSSVRSSIIKHAWESELDFLNACTTEIQAREALEDHWSHYINEKDFELLASVGINAVRIPIGYFTLGPEFATGCFKKYSTVYRSAWYYFLKLVKTAGDYNIGVLVDLHGAPGGQNTQTNCGTSSRKAHFFKHSNQAWTLKIFKKLAAELAPINNVIGLELLHEPDDDPSLHPFYIDAIRVIREASPIVLPIYMSDSFHLKKYADFIKDHLFDFVILDIHYPLQQDHLKERRSRCQTEAALLKEQKEALKYYSNQLRGNIVVGEWSLTQEDFPSQDQIGIYHQIGSGHFFCNYRTIDDADSSSFIFCHKAGLLFRDNGIIPRTQLLIIEQAIHDEYNRHITCLQQEERSYQQGFTDGYTVTLQFLNLLQSRVGLKEQLACTWSKRKFSGYNTPYKYGFVKSVSLFDQLITDCVAKSK